MTETEARQVVLLRAHETGEPGALWTSEDSRWATRLAQDTAAAGAAFERVVVTRAGHAMQRLLPRDAAGRRWLEQRAWRPLWLAAAVLAALLVGAGADRIGSGQHIDVLALPVWGLIAWNLAVYLGLLLPGRISTRGWRALLARRWLSGAGDAGASGGRNGGNGVTRLWASEAGPLAMARAALLLHAGAAALAVGIVAGLYLRGLVLDYRAGWQSTFLEPPVVQAVLRTLLAPASAATGIAVPDVAPLRLAPGTAATAPAADWIHLLAAMLALFVVLPRCVLALLAAGRAWRLSARFPLSLADPYFARLRLQLQGGRAAVQVLPYAAECGPQAVLGLRTVLAGVFGDDLQISVAATTPFGDDSATAALASPPGTTLRLLLFDLGATPEAEAQGRFIAVLAGASGVSGAVQPPLLAVADEAAFHRRFAGLPGRLAERRAGWQSLADAHGVPLLCCNLESPDVAAATAALQRLLSR